MDCGSIMKPAARASRWCSPFPLAKRPEKQPGQATRLLRRFQRRQAPLGRCPQALRPGRLTEELVCVKQRSDEGRIYGREEGDKRRPAMKGTRSIWFRALHSALTLALAGVLAVGVGQIPTAGAATFSGEITAGEAKTALVTVRAIGSG